MQTNQDEIIYSLQNLQEALDALEGDRESLAELLDIFSVEYPRQLAALRGAIDRKDPVGVRSQAHKLKASVAVFRFHEARNFAAKLEMDGLTGNLSNAADDLRQLDRSVLEQCPFLATKRSRSS